MYEWVTHMWSPLLGCPHQCSYCYVKTPWRDLPEVPILDLPFPQLGKGKTIFVGHLCDLFAEGISDTVVESVIMHCFANDNKYVFQTKNVSRILKFIDVLPTNSMIGTTIETNRADLLSTISKAPAPQIRAEAFSKIKLEKFLTIEPILDFDVEPLTELIVLANPSFINVGADSKKHNLPEPNKEKILKLVEALGKNNIPIRKKINLQRIIN